MIHFALLFSRQGKVRLSKYYKPYSQKERAKLVKEVTSQILARPSKLCNVVEHRNLKLVYKRYASLYFMLAVDDDENELIVLETIQHYVEILDRSGPMDATSERAIVRPHRSTASIAAAYGSRGRDRVVPRDPTDVERDVFLPPRCLRVVERTQSLAPI